MVLFFYFKKYLFNLLLYVYILATKRDRQCESIGGNQRVFGERGAVVEQLELAVVDDVGWRIVCRQQQQ